MTSMSDEITLEEFKAYEKVRESGKTNMWDVKAVEMLSGGVLNRQKIGVIMANYSEICKLYPGVRKGK